VEDSTNQALQTIRLALASHSTTNLSRHRSSNGRLCLAIYFIDVKHIKRILLNFSSEDYPTFKNQ